MKGLGVGLFIISYFMFKYDVINGGIFIGALVVICLLMFALGERM